jgi:hypothetical protein
MTAADGSPEMDRDELLEAVRKAVNGEHWFGEGTGGSGHMASVGLGGLEIVSQSPIERDGRPCTEVVYSYSIERMSEFGGDVRRIRKRAVLGGSGEVLDARTLEEKVYDLLTGEEREDFFGIPDV